MLQIKKPNHVGVVNKYKFLKINIKINKYKLFLYYKMTYVIELGNKLYLHYINGSYITQPNPNTAKKLSDAEAKKIISDYSLSNAKLIPINKLPTYVEPLTINGVNYKNNNNHIVNNIYKRYNQTNQLTPQSQPQPQQTQQPQQPPQPQQTQQIQQPQQPQPQPQPQQPQQPQPQPTQQPNLQRNVRPAGGCNCGGAR